MEKKGQVKKKRLKLKTKSLIKLLVVILVFFAAFFYIYKLRVKNIYIFGTENIKDVDVIKAAGLEDYPYIYHLNLKKLKNNIQTLPFVEEVKVKRNLLGKITIDIKETKILLFYKYDNKYITTNGSRVDDNKNYNGYPTLINFTPDTIFEKLIKGLNNVDYNIIKMINEIEYSPYKSKEGNIIDSNRFVLKMNDQNTVYIDTPNIKNLNKYLTVIATPDMEKTKGVIYFDTMNDQIVFRSYDAIKQEEDEQTKKAEELEKEKQEKEKKEEKKTETGD